MVAPLVDNRSSSVYELYQIVISTCAVQSGAVGKATDMSDLSTSRPVYR